MSSQQETGPYVKPFAFILRFSNTLINEYSDTFFWVQNESIRRLVGQNVEVPYSKVARIWTPTFEWYVLSVDLRRTPKIRVFKRD